VRLDKKWRQKPKKNIVFYCHSVVHLYLILPQRTTVRARREEGLGDTRAPVTPDCSGGRTSAHTKGSSVRVANESATDITCNNIGKRGFASSARATSEAAAAAETVAFADTKDDFSGAQKGAGLPHSTGRAAIQDKYRNGV
jgi:hypothetical protein